MDYVELKAAWCWECPSCEAVNYEREVIEDSLPFADEYEESDDPDDDGEYFDDESDFFADQSDDLSLIRPTSVECIRCGQTFECD